MENCHCAPSEELSERYCAVADSGSVAALYPHFIGLALVAGLGHMDTAALKDACPRHLTQAVASRLYEMTDIEGVTFASREGDDLQLWAIFERPSDSLITPRIQETLVEELEHDNPEATTAFRFLVPCMGERPVFLHPRTAAPGPVQFNFMCVEASSPQRIGFVEGVTQLPAVKKIVQRQVRQLGLDCLF